VRTSDLNIWRRRLAQTADFCSLRLPLAGGLAIGMIRQFLCESAAQPCRGLRPPASFPKGVVP